MLKLIEDLHRLLLEFPHLLWLSALCFIKQGQMIVGSAKRLGRDAVTSSCVNALLDMFTVTQS